MVDKSNIKKFFEPLYGKIAWQVKKGHGSFLTFEFGDPHFVIFREPLALCESDSEVWKRQKARRHVGVKGDWHLWIYCCDWQYFADDELRGESCSDDVIISEIVKDLDGQALTQVQVNSNGESIFEFDLGGRLETKPNREFYGEKTEQWFLYEPSGMVVTLRDDGYYSHGSGKATEEEWQLVC